MSSSILPRRRAPVFMFTKSKLIIMLLLLLAGGEFAFRGPIRLLQSVNFNDFLPLYIQSKALVQGKDPYSPAVLVQLWPKNARQPYFISQDFAHDALIVNRGIPTAYPPTCLALLAPIAMLPWPWALYVWLATNLLLLAGLFWALLTQAGFERAEWAGYVFVAASLALAPLQTGFATGSVVAAAIAICGIAVCFSQNGDRRSNWILAGILFGVAIGMKPQIGLPFLGYYLLKRRWKIVGAGFATIAVLLGAAIVRFSIGGVAWLQNYRNDNRILLTSGTLSDFTERNPLRFGLINLQILAYSILKNIHTANIAAFTSFAILLAIWIWLVLRNPSGETLLPVGTLSVMSLLPIYHRFYDATVLIFPLCWGLGQIVRHKTRMGKWVLLLIVPFLIPGGTILQELQSQGHIPWQISQSWFWECIAMPHEIWCLLFLSVVLLRSMAVTGETRLAEWFPGIHGPEKDGRADPVPS